MTRRTLGSRAQHWRRRRWSRSAWRWRRHQHRCHPGQHPADPDCDLPDFVGGTSERRRHRAQHHAGHHRQPQAFRPVRTDRPAGLHREDRQLRRRSALRRLASHQCPGAGHRPYHPPGRWPAEIRIPAVGRGVHRAAHRRAIFHLTGNLAPCRAHHFGCDLSAPDWRDGAISTAAWCSSTSRDRANAASSGSPSWTRTAPTCAP